MPTNRPAARPHRFTRRRNGSIPCLEMHTHQIIVAGSDELARQLISLRLSRRGLKVVERNDGEGAAREVLRRPARTAVVLVGELSDGTPAAFAEWLADAPSTGEIPLVVVAPRDRPDLATDARAAGADATFTLPVDLDEIIERTLELFAAPVAVRELLAA